MQCHFLKSGHDDNRSKAPSLTTFLTTFSKQKLYYGSNFPGSASSQEMDNAQQKLRPLQPNLGLLAVAAPLRRHEALLLRRELLWDRSRPSLLGHTNAVAEEALLKDARDGRFSPSLEVGVVGDLSPLTAHPHFPLPYRLLCDQRGHTVSREAQI